MPKIMLHVIKDAEKKVEHNYNIELKLIKCS